MPLVEPREGVPEPVTEPGRSGRGGRAAGRRHRPGRGRRRARLRLPVRPAGLPGAAAPAGCRHRAGRPRRASPTCPPLAPRSRTPSGCCTRPPRTCPAWTRSACTRARCSTPSWPAGCWATRRSASARWSRASSGSPWRSTTRPPTGRPGRSPIPGWPMRRSTSRCWSSCATCSSSSCAPPGSWTGPGEEFAAEAAAGQPPAPRAEPWRRTSGIHRVRGRRALAIVRALWEARDALARPRDIAPGRVLPDSAIVAAAIANPATAEELAALPVYFGRQQLRQLRRWYGAVAAARALAEEVLPLSAVPSDGPPPPHRWADRDPDAAARLVAARAALADLSARLSIPRRTCSPPTWSAGWPGRRRRTPMRPLSAPCSPPAAPARGRSSSQRRCSRMR